MNTNKTARIIGIGKYLPKNILTNQQLEKMVDTTDEWITSRTGIKERRIAASDEFTSNMGAAAAKAAIEHAHIRPDEIELIIVATLTPDYSSNCTAALVQHQLGLSNIGSMDLQAACSGFLYALATAKAFIESGMYNKILVVASEKMSSYVDYTDRNTCILFGDGAAAVVVSSSGAGFAIGSIDLGAEGQYADLITVPAGGVRNPTTLETVANKMHSFKMQGQEVFKLAVRNMGAAAQSCMSQMGLVEQDIKWVVPHQANLRIMSAVCKSLDIPFERMYITVQKYGNTSASSVPIALQELIAENTLKHSDRILLVAFGAGLTWGAAVLTKVE